MATVASPILLDGQELGALSLVAPDGGWNVGAARVAVRTASLAVARVVARRERA